MKQQFLNDSGLTELIGYIKQYVKDDQDVKPYASLSVFPKTGEQNIIYIDITTNTSYYWDDTSKTYKALDVQTWANLSGKPTTFPPSSHTHDDRYYTETEINTKLAAKADSSHKHVKADISDFPTSMPASDVSAWAKASTKPTYTKAEVGLGNVDNTADKDKSVKYATSAGSATTAATASSVDWSGVKNPPSTYAPSTHTHDDRYYTEGEVNTLLNGRAISKVLTSEDLNTVTTPGFYSAAGGNTVTNKPSNTDNFGLIVIHKATGSYYTQILFDNSNSYRRVCTNGTWSSWTQDKLTDTNTWRGIQNVLTSDSTSDSLSAAQGKALKTLVDGKSALGHKHTKSEITDFPTSMPASDVSAWAKASTKPSYTWTEINNKPSTFTPSSHTHGNRDITSLSADKITGVISLDHLPAGALERCKIVADDTARFKLTTSDVQNGDVVKVGTDANAKMYFVIDETKLSSEDGYTVFSAGTATSVPWSGVTGKPTTFTPASHTHTISDITNISSASVSYATSAGTATKLGTSAGSATQPVYFSDGKPVATTYTLGASVPSGAKFTDTNTWRGVVDNLTSTSTSDSLTANQGRVLKGLVDGKAAASHTHTIANVTGLQTALDGKASSSHTHSYLPLSGGTMTGNATFSNQKTGIVWSRVTDGASILFDADTDATDNYLEFHVTDDEGVNFKWTKTVGSENLTLGTWKREGIRLGVGSFIGSLSGNASSATKLATARKIGSASFDGTADITLASVGAAASSHTHSYAGSSSAGGAANSAVKLSTPRSINGTNFDGSGNITTSYWGTARTITIGSTGKSVNGSGNVSWSLSEIGAAAASHTHSYLPLSGGTMTGDIGIPVAKATIDGSVPYAGSAASSKNFTDFASYKTYLGSFTNTNGTWYNIISTRHRNGNSDGNSYGMMFYSSLTSNGNLLWNKQTGASTWQGERTILDSGNYTTYTVTKTGSGASGTWGISISGNAATATKATSATSATSATTCTGNAATATKLANSRTIALTGSVTGSGSFDGSGNLSIATTTNHSHSYITVQGQNSISSTTDDTTAKWGAKQTSIHFYNAIGKITDQPSQYGYLFNVGNGSEVHQIWMEQSSGRLLHRGGNGSGWNGSWRTVLDSSNYNTYTVTKTGGGASGSWGISITGNAATATNSTKWNNYELDLSTNNTTDTWLLVANNGKIQHRLSTSFAASGHTHNYAGSSSAGGSATSAVKLDTATSGSATQPVYFTGGKPTACTYTLGKSVPSNAVFTDTNTWRGIQNNLTSTSTTDSLSAAQGKILKDSKLGAVSANGYYGMAKPDGTTSDYIRTTSNGLLPYQSGAYNAGHGYIGTSSWYFYRAYVQEVNATTLNVGQANTTTNAQVELFGSTPYIDFHVGGTSTDYTSRIIAYSDRIEFVFA